MADFLDIKMTGTTRLRAGLNELADAIDGDKLLERFGPKIAKQMTDRMRAGRGDARGRAIPTRNELFDTGQMARAVDYSKSRKEVYVKTTRRGGKQFGGRTVSNARLAEIWQDDRGIPWFGVAPEDEAKLNAETITHLEREARRAANRSGGTLKVRGKATSGKPWKVKAG